MKCSKYEEKGRKGKGKGANGSGERQTKLGIDRADVRKLGSRRCDGDDTW